MGYLPLPGGTYLSQGVPALAWGGATFFGGVPMLDMGVTSLVGVVLTLTRCTYLSWGYLPLIGGGYLPQSGGCTFLGDLRKYLSLGECDGPERISLFGRVLGLSNVKIVKLSKRFQDGKGHMTITSLILH